MIMLSIFLFVLFSPFCVFSHETIKNTQFIIGSDVLEGYKKNEEENILIPYEYFSGNVKINNDQFFITSDFAKRWNKNDEEVLSIYQNVEIQKNKENLKINADTVDFYTPKNVVYISGDVHCQKNDIFFYTDNCEYDLGENIVQYKEGGYFIKNTLNENEKIILNSNVGICNLNDNSVDLSGDIEIKNKDFNIKCDRVTYNANDNEIRCSGNLNIYINDREGEYISTEEDCVYDTKKQRFYISHGLYHSTEQLIYGKNLVFDQNEKIVTVNNGVEVLMRNKMRFTCQNCVYNTNSMHGELKGDTVMYKLDSSKDNFLYLYSDFFSFDIVNNSNSWEENEEDELDKFNLLDFGKEEIIYKSSEEKQSSEVEKIKKNNKRKSDNNKNKINIVINGEENVCICTNNFQCRSDKIRFEGSCIYIPNDSIIWNNRNLMLGKEIKVKLVNNGIEKITINSEPFILIIDDLDFYNQVSGEKMIANIVNNNIDKTLFLNNVDTFYYLLSEKKLTGVNRLKCSKFCAIFDCENKLSKILFDNQIYGNFFFPDYVANNKQKLVLDRFREKAEFIKNTQQPDLEKIKSKINTIPFIKEEDKKKLFEE